MTILGFVKLTRNTWPPGKLIRSRRQGRVGSLEKLFWERSFQFPLAGPPTVVGC